MELCGTEEGDILGFDRNIILAIRYVHCETDPFKGIYYKREKCSILSEESFKSFKKEENCCQNNALISIN